MIGAAQSSFQTAWPLVENYAKSELTQCSRDLAQIAEYVATGQMTPERAADHVEMQRNSMKAVLTTVEGITELAAEQAINAALSIISATVNSAIGFALL